MPCATASCKSSEPDYPIAPVRLQKYFARLGNLLDRTQSVLCIPSCSIPHSLVGGSRMLWTIAVILLILWLLGMVSSYTLGGFIHILLVLAIIVVLIRVIQGRSPV